MIRQIIIILYLCVWAPDFWVMPKYDHQLDRTRLSSSLKVKLALIIRAFSKKKYDCTNDRNATNQSSYSR